jgi:hypothetical protein
MIADWMAGYGDDSAMDGDIADHGVRLVLRTGRSRGRLRQRATGRASCPGRRTTAGGPRGKQKLHARVAYETGALVAAERDNCHMWAVHVGFVPREVIATVPASVLTQAWRSHRAPVAL